MPGQCGARSQGRGQVARMSMRPRG